MNKPKKCNFHLRAKPFAESEAGCSLNHCYCGTHDACCEEHKCDVKEYEEYDFDVLAAERVAGWDSNP
jgi:hypothetical protein